MKLVTVVMLCVFMTGSSVYGAQISESEQRWLKQKEWDKEHPAQSNFLASINPVTIARTWYQEYQARKQEEKREKELQAQAERVAKAIVEFGLCFGLVLPQACNEEVQKQQLQNTVCATTDTDLKLKNTSQVLKFIKIVDKASNMASQLQAGFARSAARTSAEPSVK